MIVVKANLCVFDIAFCVVVWCISENTHHCNQKNKVNDTDNFYISDKTLYWYVVGRFDHNGMINDRKQCLPSCRSTDFYKICTQVTKDTNNNKTEDSNKTNDNKDNNKNNDSNKDIVKITKDEPQPNDNDNLKDILSIIAIILGLAGITLIIIVVVKRKKNVKIYLEEAGERALIGKERLTKDDRTLNLNKYYEKYKEDEYKIVLSKSISKKLDQEVINVVVNGKNKAFKVNYKGKKIEYII